jgi:hypothetical protein
MPARKKSADARIDRRAQRDLVVLPGALKDSPEPGSDWLAASKREWAAFFSSTQAATLDESTVPGVHRLFGMRDLQRRA